MAIYYAHDEQGAFIAGDSDSGLTSYAYCTSPFADAARCDPNRVAHEMINEEEAVAFTHTHAGAFADYDMRNWKRLHDLTADHTTRSIIDAIMSRLPATCAPL